LSTKAELINSGVLLVTLAMAPYTLLRSTIVTTALFVAGANHGIVFPMTHLSSCFNMQWVTAQRLFLVNLSLAVSSPCIAFPVLVLTAQVLPKNTTLSLFRINMLINGFMADV